MDIKGINRKFIERYIARREQMVVIEVDLEEAAVKGLEDIAKTWNEKFQTNVNIGDVAGILLTQYILQLKKE
jgi:hypothetical protein